MTLERLSGSDPQSVGSSLGVEGTPPKDETVKTKTSEMDGKVNELLISEKDNFNKMKGCMNPQVVNQLEETLSSEHTIKRSDSSSISTPLEVVTYNGTSFNLEASGPSEGSFTFGMASEKYKVLDKKMGEIQWKMEDFAEDPGNLEIMKSDIDAVAGEVREFVDKCKTAIRERGYDPENFDSDIYDSFESNDVENKDKFSDCEIILGWIDNFEDSLAEIVEGFDNLKPVEKEVASASIEEPPDSVETQQAQSLDEVENLDDDEKIISNQEVQERFKSIEKDASNIISMPNQGKKPEEILKATESFFEKLGELHGKLRAKKGAVEGNEAESNMVKEYIGKLDEELNRVSVVDFKAEWKIAGAFVTEIESKSNRTDEDINKCLKKLNNLQSQMERVSLSADYEKMVINDISEMRSTIEGLKNKA